MNKYQEALDLIRKPYIEGTKELEYYMLLLQELLDKATPKKVTMQGFGQYIITYNGQCKCGGFITRSDNYCHDCGQALDWSEDE